MKEPGIKILLNPIKEYPWGSRTAIPEFLGVSNPGDKPQAELWMGSHPLGSSWIEENGSRVLLKDAISRSPADWLGHGNVEKFQGRLPFLFKVLAAAMPLSIQAHPNAAQAQKGFAREENLGLSPDSPERCYKDDSDKPEIICALTPFWLLKGFRKIIDLIQLLDQLDIHEIGPELSEFKGKTNQAGLRRFYAGLLIMDKERQRRAVGQAVLKAAEFQKESPVFEWIGRLNRQFPGDMGVLSPVILNLLRLKPGEALFLPAGVLHSYLEGTGIELMSNSDNVLRGGLTSKYVNIPELLNILVVKPEKIKALTPTKVRECEEIYPSETEKFRLSRITVNPSASYRLHGNRGMEIVLCAEGRAEIAEKDSGAPVPLVKGSSVAVPARVESYTIQGSATLFKASIP